MSNNFAGFNFITVLLFNLQDDTVFPGPQLCVIFCPACEIDYLNTLIQKEENCNCCAQDYSCPNGSSRDDSLCFCISRDNGSGSLFLRFYKTAFYIVSHTGFLAAGSGRSFLRRNSLRFIISTLFYMFFIFVR